MEFNMGSQIGQNPCPEKLRPLIFFIWFVGYKRSDGENMFSIFLNAQGLNIYV